MYKLEYDKAEDTWSVVHAETGIYAVENVDKKLAKAIYIEFSEAYLAEEFDRAADQLQAGKKPYPTKQCPVCGKCACCTEKKKPTSRSVRAAKLAQFLKKEFSRRKVLVQPTPAVEMAQIANDATARGYISKSTSKTERVMSLYKHLHAYAEGLKPYGPKSRRTGAYGDWFKKKYGEGESAKMIDQTLAIMKEYK